MPQINCVGLFISAFGCTVILRLDLTDVQPVAFATCIVHRVTDTKKTWQKLKYFEIKTDVKFVPYNNKFATLTRKNFYHPRSDKGENDRLIVDNEKKCKLVLAVV